MVDQFANRIDPLDYERDNNARTDSRCETRNGECMANER